MSGDFLEALHEGHQVLDGDEFAGTMVEPVVNFLGGHFALAILRRKRLTMTSLPRNSYNCRASSSSHKLKFAGALKGEKVAPVKSAP